MINYVHTAVTDNIMYILS